MDGAGLTFTAMLLARAAKASQRVGRTTPQGVARCALLGYSREPHGTTAAVGLGHGLYDAALRLVARLAG